MCDSVLGWLYEHRNDFITYTVIRSYLGLARRDAKFYYKFKNDRDRSKRLGHIIRGYIYCDAMMHGTFDMEEVNSKFRSIDKDVSNDVMLKEYSEKVNALREELNQDIDINAIVLPKHFSPEAAAKMDRELRVFCKSDTFIEKQSFLCDFDMGVFYDSFENWVSYDH
jgi:hypothetical protein